MSENRELRQDAVPPVVGIGASAGGLEALLEMFACLPRDSGFAYIVLLHSSPDHPSLLAEILSGHTPLPVREAGNDQEVERGHAYIVPPGIFPDFIDGRLVFLESAEAGASPKPIDHLFRTMAAALGRKAIGVVLSGTGSDGALGIQAIKARGGLALVQDPDSALFNAMPRSAVEFGGADFIGSPPEIAEELARLGQQPPSETGGGHPPAIGGDDLDRVFAILRAACGIDFSHYKRSTIHRRLIRRLVLNKIHGIEDYLKLLHNNPDEATALSQDFLIRVTAFFRDPDMFQSLAAQVFPRLAPSRSPGEPIRVWVPGCSTGEEVYSIAIALLEFLGERTAEAPIVLFGTDLSGPAIERARAGLYSRASLQWASPEHLERFFTRVDGQYQISAAVRDLCVFARHNVARDPPFSRLDLISCCNLFIYFGPVLQKRVTATFHYALKPGGFLVLGSSESISPQCGKLFGQIDKRQRVYLRKNEPNCLPFDLSLASENLMTFNPFKAAPEDSRSLDLDAMQKEIDQLILQRYAPAALVIDEHQNAVQFGGELGAFLNPRSGPASLNLARLVQPALLAAIVSAVDEARAGGAPVRRENLRLEANLGERHINLNVAPLREGFEEGRYFLVLFEDVSVKPQEASTKGRLSGFWSGWLRGRAQATAVRADSIRLERELDAARNHLRAIFEAYEGIQEKLKSSQKELRSAKEGFQITHEELETAKEELQATNEELITANEELQLRNNELNRTNADLCEARDYAQAIVDTTQDALLVLDPKLRVLRANRAFSELFRIPREAVEHHLLSDIGQGVLNRAGLLDQVRRVAIKGEPIENLEWTLDIPSRGSWVLVFNARRLWARRTCPA